MKKSKIVTTELYETVNDRYITVMKTETETSTYYELGKEKQNDKRSTMSLTVNEDEARALFSLLKEILEVKE